MRAFQALVTSSNLVTRSNSIERVIMTLQEKIDSIKKRIEDLRQRIGYYDDVVESQIKQHSSNEMPKKSAEDLKALLTKNKG